MTPEHNATRGTATPDFATLYEDSFSKGGAITRRMAYWLWVSCLYLSDAWRDARDEPALLHDYFPPLARPLAHGAWLDRFIDCFDRLADGLANGAADGERLARCTGEEFALHLAIDHAETNLQDGLLGPDVGAAGTLPDHGAEDENFDRARDRLFADSDVMILFDMSMDGVEDPDSGVNRIERYANLHPRDWFKLFVDS
jgi:hypothetical protein